MSEGRVSYSASGRWVAPEPPRATSPRARATTAADTTRGHFDLYPVEVPAERPRVFEGLIFVVCVNAWLCWLAFAVFDVSRSDWIGATVAFGASLLSGVTAWVTVCSRDY